MRSLQQQAAKTLIYPATKHHLEKYRKKEELLSLDTYQNYIDNILPDFYKNKYPQSILWIENIYIFAHHFWRDGRVVECTGLENQRTAMYRGFESLSLRIKVLAINLGLFFN